MSAQFRETPVSSVLVRSGGGGPARVFLIQTRNQAEAAQLQQLFDEIEEYCPVRLLASGVTTAYAVQGARHPAMLEELESVLKTHFRFSVVYEGFNPVIQRIVEDLAIETSSRLYPVPQCRSCGETDPFAAELTVRRAGRRERFRARFCDRCIASSAREDEAESLNGLLESQSLQPLSGRDVIRRRGFLRRALRRPRRAAAPAAHPPTPAPVMEPERLAS